MIYKGLNGLEYCLDKNPLAQGGEGKIYAVKDNPKILAKLYNDHFVTVEKEKKLTVMVNNPINKSAINQVAWPLDVLYDSDNRFVGFTMQKLNFNDSLPTMYEYGSTAKYPNISWSNKIVIAKNICVVLDAIHSAGHIIGDFNPDNISVDSDTGRVAFMDTDSYHIDDNGNVYRCNVGMPEYLPVEIQRKIKYGLGVAPLPTFSMESDNFALAVHIFQLLMNGTHPFACKILPGASSMMFPQPTDNILNGVFPFVQPAPETTIPLYAPHIDILPSYMVELFNRAFVSGHDDPSSRPNAEEWYKALDKMGNELVCCKRVSHHEYHQSSQVCPWCELDNRFSESVKKSKKDKKKAKQAKWFGDETSFRVSIPSETRTTSDWIYVHPEWITETNKKLKAILEYAFGQAKQHSPFHCDDVIVISSNPSNRFFLLLDKSGFEIMDIVLNERYTVNDDGWYFNYKDGELFIRDIVWDDDNFECHFNAKYCLDRGSHAITIKYNTLLTSSDYRGRGYTERIEEDNKNVRDDLIGSEMIVPSDW